MGRTTNYLNWVNSEGGPLILMEERLLIYWKGCFSVSNSSGKIFELSGDEYSLHNLQHDSDGSNLTDYDRACSVDDYLGLIAVGPGWALVLGDEPMQTAWWPIPKISGGILVRWRWANDEQSVVKALGGLHKAIGQPSDLVLQVSTNFLILFDSASPGSDIDSSVEINLTEGRYLIDTAHYQPNKEISLVLHRLIPAAQ